MNFVKFLLVIATFLAGNAMAQGGIVYNHRGDHHSTTLVLPFGQPQVRVVPVMPAPAYTTPYVIPQIGGNYGVTGNVPYFVPSLPMNPPAHLNGLQANWVCAAHERPVPANGWHPACAYGNQIRLVPQSEWQVNASAGSFPALGHGGHGQRQHAGTRPRNADGSCPIGMVPSPHTPQQLPGCW